LTQPALTKTPIFQKPARLIVLAAPPQQKRIAMPSHSAELSAKMDQTLDKESIDILGELGYPEVAVNDDLLRLLREKIEYHRTQLMAYEKALTAATREANPTATASTREGQLSRHYVKGAKLEYILGLLEHRSDGMTPSQMREQARKDDIAVNAAFPYSMLKALKEGGKVEEIEGKYFLSKRIETYAVDSKDSRATKRPK
jgi:hypothetical protein